MTKIELFYRFFIGITFLEFTNAKRKVVISESGRSHGKHMTNHHLNISRSDLSSLFDSLTDDREGLISLISESPREKNSTTESRPGRRAETTTRSDPVRGEPTTDRYNDKDPLDLAGQHADLDYVINTVREHKEKMLQKPNLYNRDLKRLYAALQA